MEPTDPSLRKTPGLRFWLGVCYGGLVLLLVLVVAVSVERVASRELQRGVADRLDLSAQQFAIHLEHGPWGGEDPETLLRGAISVLVLDAEGRVLRGPEGLIGLEVGALLEVPARAGSIDGRRAVWPDGMDAVAGWSPLSPASVARGTGSTVVVRQSARDALAPLTQMRTTAVWVSLLLGLAGVAAAILLGRWLGLPLLRIARGAARIRRGESGAALSDPGGYREARVLAASLRELVADLRGREADLVQLNESLERRVSQRTSELKALNSQLETLALTDALTGLANRRRFDEEIVLAVERASEQDLPLSLLLFDLDRFKDVNDAHGHPAGDAVLRWVADVAGEHVRGTDLLARTGGEEFAVLAIDTPVDQALALGERLRRAIQTRGPVPVGRVAIPLTISVGVAAVEYLRDEVMLMDATTIGARLLSDADAALYRAKQRGRNRVQSA